MYIEIDKTDRAHLLDPHAGALCRPHRGLKGPVREHLESAVLCLSCARVAKVDADMRTAASPVYLLRLRARLVSSVVGLGAVELLGRTLSKVLTRRSSGPTTESLKRAALLLACPDGLFSGDTDDVHEYPVPVWDWLASARGQASAWREYERCHAPRGANLDPTAEESRAYWDTHARRPRAPGRPISAPLSELRSLLQEGLSVTAITRQTGIEHPTILKYARQWGLHA